jgi:hypothetical protein
LQNAIGNLRSKPATSQREVSRPYAGSIDLKENGPAGAVMVCRVTVTCATSGSVCRRTTDCVPHPDIVFQPPAGHRRRKCAFAP